MPTAKIKCRCYSPYQDKLYGQGIRIGNLSISAEQKKEREIHRCTVCGKMGR